MSAPFRVYSKGNIFGVEANLSCSRNRGSPPNVPSKEWEKEAFWEKSSERGGGDRSFVLL